MRRTAGPGCDRCNSHDGTDIFEHTGVYDAMIDAIEGHPSLNTLLSDYRAGDFALRDEVMSFAALAGYAGYGSYGYEPSSGD